MNFISLEDTKCACPSEQLRSVHEIEEAITWV